jgi:hypothetical protein
MPISSVTLVTANPMYSFAPILQFGAWEAGNAALGTKADKAYETKVPEASSTVHNSGSKSRHIRRAS